MSDLYGINNEVNSVICPDCGAEPGKKCTVWPYHQVRWSVWKKKTNA